MHAKTLEAAAELPAIPDDDLTDEAHINYGKNKVDALDSINALKKRAKAEGHPPSTDGESSDGDGPNKKTKITADEVAAGTAAAALAKAAAAKAKVAATTAAEAPDVVMGGSEAPVPTESNAK